MKSKGLFIFSLMVVVIIAIWIFKHDQDLQPADPKVDPISSLVIAAAQSKDLEFQIDVLTGIQDGVQTKAHVGMPRGWEKIEAKINQKTDSRLKKLVEGLSIKFGSPKAMASQRKRLMDVQTPLTQRLESLHSLLEAKDPQLVALLQDLLKEPSLRAETLRGLAVYDDPKSASAILAVYNNLSPAEKRDALNTLTSRAAFAEQLLQAVAKGDVARRDVTADYVRQLTNLKNPSITEKVEKIWGVVQLSQGDTLKEIQKFKALVESSPEGNTSNGRAVFARTCMQCHTLFETGGKVGPDITGSNRKDIGYLLENIINPNAVIPNDYRATSVETKDDRFLTGIITKEDPQSITLVTMNETVILPREQIQSLEQEKTSMMPTGLIQALTETEVRDLFAYLKSSQQVPMLANSNNLTSFFNGRDLTGWEGDPKYWSVQNGEIVGKSPGLDKNEFIAGPLLLRDFRLILKAKLTPNKENSGIQFRSTMFNNNSVKGYQADMGIDWWGKLYEEHGRKVLWEKHANEFVKEDDWNVYEILAVGSKIQTAINGHESVNLDDPQGAREGIIAFQIHKGGPLEVRFKDFQFEIDPKPKLITVK
jgi:putative heme-binding domain-containing protein